MDRDFTLADALAPIPTVEEVERAHEEALVGTPQLESQGYMVSFTKQSPIRIERKNGTQYVVQVIEDDPDLGQLLIDVFMTHGFEVRWATTKAEINQALRRGTEIDVLLLDRELPDANGLTILQAIRGHPQLNTLPVIMVTGLAGPNEVAEGLVAGADGYVSKPFKLSALLKSVQLVLGIA
ncbi:Sensor histidine kinase RcsC [Usitatibacter rugosus]|uniref:Sensor histidine kinase RcsC n=1 Tax=Usitatibacter rugosus TaxID=2732067 RepID=A0A6M4GR43_9PROT|nr:response regulator [Usitatibacter rugosus]QJR09546.1 Sensor histidine kinase RcsC [Usitatibacter rugosus]